MAGQQARKRPRAEQGRPVLVILDMNGVLLVRSGPNRQHAELRPHLEQFLATLFGSLAGRVEVAVWSSMMERNLSPLVDYAFGDYAANLAFVWDQQQCTERWTPHMSKPLLRKDLKWLRESPWASSVPDRVLLIDDDPVKCTANPAGTAIHPPTFTGTIVEGEAGPPDTELLRLAAYIEAIVQALTNSECTSVPEFVLSWPFASWEWSAPAPNPAKRRRGGQEGKPFSPGEAVEVYWPDEERWLSATILKVRNDGEFRIRWEEDASESSVPPDYVRRPRLDAAPARSPWQRMESRRSAGAYYYYNGDTGESQAEPPAPWEQHEVAGRPGVYYYYNPVSNRRSAEKPELSDTE